MDRVRLTLIWISFRGLLFCHFLSLSSLSHARNISLLSVSGTIPTQFPFRHSFPTLVLKYYFMLIYLNYYFCLQKNGQNNCDCDCSSSSYCIDPLRGWHHYSTWGTKHTFNIVLHHPCFVFYWMTRYFSDLLLVWISLIYYCYSRLICFNN
jgi:hypothetical protein